MFSRLLTTRLHHAAAQFPVVVILGARQVGKTTLARTAFASHRYLDLEDPRTAQRFRADARFELDAIGSSGAVLDEAQAVPEVFAALRGAVDASRRVNGQFIVLGSAQPALVRSVSESLAGRAAVLELDPLMACEVQAKPDDDTWSTLWLAGGFPDALTGAFKAPGATTPWRDWWESYLRLVIERDLPQYGVQADALFLRRLLSMLAHVHGQLLNVSSLGASLGVSNHTLMRHLNMLESVHLVRRLAPYYTNIGKRLTKSTKVYLRDSGLLHHLLNISSLDALRAHPSLGASWEGFVIEDILRRERVHHPQTQPYFWRTAAGAEVDLLLDRQDRRIAVEIKAGRGDQATAIRHLRQTLPDLGAERAWIVDSAPGIERVSSSMARAGFASVIHGSP